MRIPAVAAVLAMCMLSGVAEAGKRSKNAEAEAAVEQAPPEPVFKAALTGVFPSALDGWNPGGLPSGLASLSAQSCNACHYEAHDDWAASAHGRPGSEAWRQAAQEVGTPACTSCHLPLTIQRADTVTYDAGDVTKPITAPNPTFDAGLSIEGVTCAACHVREAAIVRTAPVSQAPAAHPGMAWSEELGTSESCASCHQLTWPGATQPLYDTYGEWSRSAHGQAGIGCVDCHLGPGAQAGTVRHDLSASPARALTIDIQLPTLTVSRDGDALEGRVTVANTGAGHSVPTGSPWRALQIELLLERPAQGKEKEPVQVARTVTPLARTLAAEAPWQTTDDTRLTAGERRTLAWSGALTKDNNAGDWAFVVRVREVLRGQPAETVLVERRVPLRVD